MTISYLQQLFKFQILYLLVLLAMGIFLRVHYIGNYDYGSDQIMHIQIAEGRDLNEVWKFSQEETHPPFGHFLRHLWMKVSRDTAWMQALSILSDSLLIGMFFVLGNRLYPHAGIIAATLAAISPAFISLSQVARNYSFFSLFLICCLYGYFRFLEKREVKWLGFYSLFACLVVGTHFGGIIPIFAIALAALPVLYREKNMLCLWLAANCCAGLLFLFFYASQDWSLSIVYNFPIRSYSKASILVNIGDTIQAIIEYPYYILANLPSSLAGEATSFLFILTIISVTQIRISHPTLYTVIIIALLTWLVLCICSFYNVLYRRNIWVAPFIILPISLFLTKAYADITLNMLVKRGVLSAFMIGICCYIAFWPDEPALHDEAVTKTDTARVHDYAFKHMQPDDIVVGGKASMIWLYSRVLGQNYYNQIPPLQEKAFYTTNRLDIRDIVIKTTSPQGTIFISTPFYYILYPADRFVSFFQQLTNKGWMDGKGSIWFYSSVHGEELIAQHLLNCPALQPEITHRLLTSNPNMFLFSLPKAILNAITSPQGRYYHCLF